MTTTKRDATTTIDIKPVQQGVIKLRLIGTTPLFQNKMSAKVKQGLLVGSRKKTKVERLDIKHDVFAEFLNSAETIPDGPTALGLKVTAIKAAMCNAAIETAGLTKTGVQRLLFMPGEYAPLYGQPQIRMDVVRSADMNRTPDIRTRAFLPKWGAEVEIRFTIPQLTANSVVALLCNAGMLIGVGDFRQEKGKGAFGSFRVLGPGTDDPEWDELIANHGRVMQELALKNPSPANDETEELIEFYQSEKDRRAA